MDTTVFDSYSKKHFLTLTLTLTLKRPAVRCFVSFRLRVSLTAAADLLREIAHVYGSVFKIVLSQALA